MRIISRLDVKPPHVVKPVFFDGLRKMGSPVVLANKYFEEGADEVIFIDIVASLYRRDIQFDLIHEVSKGLFIPFGVGGGIKNVEDVKKLIHGGADKVIINTHAITHPKIISEIAELFGSQACTVHIQAKNWNEWYECYTDCGRNRSLVDVIDWAKQVEDLGAGEIILSAIDQDGYKHGFDLNLVEQVLDAVNIPVVIGSGAGSLDDILEVAQLAPSAIAIASVLHYETLTVQKIKSYLQENGIEVQI
jgi:imidazole glycerol-phosphate synthase subunit HisF